MIKIYYYNLEDSKIRCLPIKFLSKKNLDILLENKLACLHKKDVKILLNKFSDREIEVSSIWDNYQRRFISEYAPNPIFLRENELYNIIRQAELLRMVEFSHVSLKEADKLEKKLNRKYF